MKKKHFEMGNMDETVNHTLYKFWDPYR